MASTVGLCAPWRPGRSGNPEGFSKKRRQAKKLREALALLLASRPPELLLKLVPHELRQALPVNATYAEVIALRIALIASMARKPEHVLAAGRLILEAETKMTPNVPPGHKPKPPILPSTDERRRAVAEQLGVEWDAETGDRGDSPAASCRPTS